MPPCLFAIRSLLGSSRRHHRIFRPISRHLEHQCSSISTAQQQNRRPWRSPAHNRRGIVGDGDGAVKDEETKKNLPSHLSKPSRYSPSTPTETTKRALGARTSIEREHYVSSSKFDIVRVISKGKATHAYSSQWQPVFAKLQLLGYTERQDENPTTKWRKLVMFEEGTVELAKQVRTSLIHHHQNRSLLPRTQGVMTSPADVAQQDQEMSGWQAISDKLDSNDHDQWFGVMLYLLAYCPESALSFLAATHRAPYPPIHAVQDSLRLLSRLFHSHPDHLQRQRRLQRLGDVVTDLAHRTTGESLSLLHGALARILPALRSQNQRLLWNSVREHRIHTHWHTHLHFATHFARANHFDQALDAVSEAHKNGANLNSNPFLSTCSTLLRSAMRQPSGLRVCLRVVDHLVEMGVTLNLILCNIIMLNAVEAHDLTTAWSIYHSLPNYGLEADGYTFAILLKACKVNLDDADMLNETIRNAISHVDVKNDPILAADILHTLALHHTKLHPEKAFEIIAAAYSQLFDTTPLSDLGILPPSPSSSGDKKMPPSHPAIGIILTTYLHQLFLQTQSPTQPRALFQRYRTLVDAGVEPWCSMIDRDYIPNAFLATLTKTKAGLLPAAEIIKTMQRVVPAGKESKVKQCEPTVQTWTIFLHGFQRHGQMKMAEQVFGYMKRKGIVADRVAWNILVDGYAVLQDAEGVEEVLGRLKEEGIGWDEWTERSVGKLKRSLGTKQSDEEARELDFTGDLRDRLERKIIEGQESNEKEIVEKEEGKYTPIV